jgi:hypothetical protein
MEIKRTPVVLTITDVDDIYIRMNDKIQAILLKIIVHLKQNKWRVGPDWEITLKSEHHVPMSTRIFVEGNIADEEWSDNIETNGDLSLTSDDQVTFFPSVTIYSQIFIDGGTSKDITYKIDVDVAFTESDLSNDSKAQSAAARITRLVEDYIENEYSDYVDENGEAIQDHKNGGWKADDDAYHDR